MDFWRAVEILNKRKWLILLSTVLATLLTFGATRLVGSRWQATVRFVTPPSSTAMSGTEDIIGMRKETPGRGNHQEQAEMYEEIVRSRDVLEPALRKSRITQLPPNFLEGIQFEVKGPRFYQLIIQDASPARAEVIANALAESFVDRFRSLYTQQAEKVVKMLEDQLRDADARLAEIRNRYDGYRRNKNIVTTVNDQLGTAMFRFQSARQKRDDVADRLAEARARLAEREAELSTLPATISSIRPVEQSPLVIQLEGQLAKVEAELIDLRNRYTDEQIEVRRRLALRDSLEGRLKAERERQSTFTVTEPNPQVGIVKQSIGDLKQEIRGFGAQLASLDTTVSQARGDINSLMGVDGPLNSIMDEMQQASDNRANVVERLHAARGALDVAERQNPIAIMDRVNDFNPPVNTTIGRTRKLILLAALCALVGTAGLILAFDSVDRRLRSVKQAEGILPAPVLAAIPQPIGRMNALTMARATELLPLSVHSEAYRFLGLHLLSTRGPRIRSIMVISAKAEQGSTRTATNLGITLAQAGQRVIVVDANVRTPSLHEVFDLSNDVGFTNLLQKPDDAALEEALRPTSLPNLRIVTAGPATDNPWELFRSQNLVELSQRLRDLADYVIFDTPSALAFTDALNLAPAVDAAFLCVRALEPPSGAEQQLVDMLKQADVQVLGAVLNDVPASVLESFQNYQKYYPTTADVVPMMSSRAGESSVATRKTRSWMRLPKGSYGPQSHGHGPSGSGHSGSNYPGHGPSDRV